VEFSEFPKIARWSREVIITEKIDGTNASVGIVELTDHDEIPSTAVAVSQDRRLCLFAGSRSRWISPKDDNHGFATWVQAHADDLFTLGPGHHFGEWWGSGVQRGYGLTKGEKRFSLFNTSRWSESRPGCCSIVPVLYQGMLLPGVVENALEALRVDGSRASPGFNDPEGVILFHVAGNVGFKKTLKKDEEPKGKS